MGIDTELFVPYTSDRNRLLINTDRYITEWDAAPQNIESVLAKQDEERPNLDMGSEEICYGKRTWEIPHNTILHSMNIFRRLANYTNLDFTDDVKLAHLSRIVAKRVQDWNKMKWKRNGCSGKYNPISTDAIISSLQMDSNLMRKRMELHAAHFMGFIDKGLQLLEEYRFQPDSVILPGLTFETGYIDSPLCGVNELSSVEQIRKDEFLEFCKGFVQFAYADYYKTRIDTMKHFELCLDGKTPFRLGYGGMIPFDMDALSGTHPYDVSVDGHTINENNLEEMAQKGFVIYDPRGFDHPRAKNYYCSFMDEYGISDLCGMLIIGEGKIDRLSNMRKIGGLLNDALDTMKEYLYDPFYGSLPFFMARYAEENVKNVLGMELVSDQKKREFTYLVSVLNHKKIYKSQSHRRFVQGERTFVNRMLTDDYDGVHLAFYFNGRTRMFPLKKVWQWAMERYENFYKRVA